MSRAVVLMTTILATLALVVECASAQDVREQDFFAFLDRQPYQVVVISRESFRDYLYDTAQAEFLPVRFVRCKANGSTSDTAYLLESNVHFGSRTHFTLVPTRADSLCGVFGSTGAVLPYRETSGPRAPSSDSIVAVTNRIAEYGDMLADYNQLRAQRPDPGGMGMLVLSGCLMAGGIYGLIEGDDGGKVAGAAALLVSPLAVVASVKQVKEDRNRERRITEIALSLKAGF